MFSLCLIKPIINLLIMSGVWRSKLTCSKWMLDQMVHMYFGTSCWEDVHIETRNLQKVRNGWTSVEGLVVKTSPYGGLCAGNLWPHLKSLTICCDRVSEHLFMLVRALQKSDLLACSEKKLWFLNKDIIWWNLVILYNEYVCLW